MTPFLIILVVGIGTYVMRALFIVALANRRIPPAVVEALEFVAPAVLTALIVSLLVNPDGSANAGWVEIVALVAGGATVYKTRSLLLAGTVGMTVFWVLRALF